MHKWVCTIKSEFATYDPLFPTSSAAFIPVALHFLPVALLCAAANQQTHCERRVAVPHAAGIGAMGWSAGTIALGTPEAEGAQTALVRAVVELGGAQASTPGESDTQQLWRCGKLRSSSPSAVPLLRLAVQNTDAR